jgi:hypothetical protein
MQYTKKISVGAFAKKGEDYKEGDLLTIANEGKKIPSSFDPEKTQDVFLVKLPKGDEKNINVNQTSINNLIDAYGGESVQWVGKQVKVWLITQSVSGKLQKVTYLSHPLAEMVESRDGGMGWQIPGKQPEAPTNPGGHPADEINPDDIPF